MHGFNSPPLSDPRSAVRTYNRFAYLGTSKILSMSSLTQPPLNVAERLASKDAPAGLDALSHDGLSGGSCLSTVVCFEDIATTVVGRLAAE